MTASSPIQPPTALAILRELRRRLDDPAAWCQHTLALDAAGRAVKLDNPTAVKRCLVGWLFLVGAVDGVLEPPTRLAEERIRAACAARGFRGLSHFNDAEGTTHADVLALVDEVISAEERHGAGGELCV